VDEERLIADDEVFSIAVDGLSHDFRPGIDEALLQQGRFKALFP